MTFTCNCYDCGKDHDCYNYCSQADFSLIEQENQPSVILETTRPGNKAVSFAAK